MPTHTQNEPLVFDYVDIRDFLTDLFRRKKAQRPRFSVRAWAKQLGYRGPTLLLNILSGQRKINPDMGERIGNTLDLSTAERKYFDTLVVAARAKTRAEKKVYLERLESLRPDKYRSEMRAAHFRYIAEWYHLAILEMLALKDFKSEPSYLSKRLRGKVSDIQVATAVERLRNLGLVKGKHQLRRSRKNPISRDEVPSEAIRNHHREMLMRAREALREQPLEQRDFRSTKLAIRKADLPIAKEIIRNFHRAIQRLSVQESADEVYAFNTTFFGLTGSRAP